MLNDQSGNGDHVGAVLEQTGDHRASAIVLTAYRDLESTAAIASLPDVEADLYDRGCSYSDQDHATEREACEAATRS